MRTASPPLRPSLLWLGPPFLCLPLAPLRCRTDISRSPRYMLLRSSFQLSSSANINLPPNGPYSGRTLCHLPIRRKQLPRLPISFREFSRTFELPSQPLRAAMRDLGNSWFRTALKNSILIRRTVAPFQDPAASRTALITSGLCYAFISPAHSPIFADFSPLSTWRTNRMRVPRITVRSNNVSPFFAGCRLCIFQHLMHKFIRKLLPLPT